MGPVQNELVDPWWGKWSEMGRASRANQAESARTESACALREIFILMKRHFGYIL